MAPKRQAAMLLPVAAAQEEAPAAAAAVAAAVPAPMAVAPAPRAPAPPRGLTACRFYAAVAVAAGHGSTAKQARAVLRACQKVVAGELLRGCRQVGVPNVCSVRVRVLPERTTSSQKTVFGKLIDLKPRAASRMLKASPVKAGVACRMLLVRRACEHKHQQSFQQSYRLDQALKDKFAGA